MDLIVEKYPGVTSIHDDIVFNGTSDEDHDTNLINLLNVAKLEGLVLKCKKQPNSTAQLKQPKMSFFGAEYSTDAMHLCQKKIQEITEITLSMDKQPLTSFIGMVTHGELYSTSLLPSLPLG